MSATHSARPTIFFARNKIFFARNKIFFAHNKIFFAHNKNKQTKSRPAGRWMPAIDAGYRCRL